MMRLDFPVLKAIAEDRYGSFSAGWQGTKPPSSPFAADANLVAEVKDALERIEELEVAVAAVTRNRDWLRAEVDKFMDVVGR